MAEMIEHQDLKKYTTFRAGGTARYFAVVTTAQELREALQFAFDNDLEYRVIGAGSNTLFRDREFPGLIIKMQMLGFDIDEEQLTVRAEAGVPFSRLVKETVRKGYKGFEWGTGLPGSVGGAIRGNAGCFGGETKDNLLFIEALKVQDGTMKEIQLKKDELQMSYRDTMLKHDKSIIVTAGTWQLEKGNPEVLKEIYDSNMKAKLAAQPTGEFCAGSFFKGISIPGLSTESNTKTQKFQELKKGDVLPTSLMIDKALNMKGVAHGGAQVSPKHAGFIINTGEATTSDILELASTIEQRMKDEYGIELEKEIEVI